MIATRMMTLLRRLDPEQAHGVALAALRAGLGGRAAAPDPMLATTALGRQFATPIGLAAGFDKNAVAVQGLLALGFGHVEIGTVTLLPQPGNPRPRLFRLPEDQAVINRMGFNGQGAEVILRRVRRLPAGLPIGINIGINKHGAVPLRDYPALAERFAPHARYLVINVSSPNTPGLRDLQAEDTLAALLAALPQDLPPVLVKLAPELGAAALPSLIERCVDAGIAGLVIANTTLARPDTLRSPNRSQSGGLSGAPLFEPATAMLARAFGLARGRLTLIGVGGIRTGQHALDKLKAGASLLQLYTAFAYEGPALVARLNAELAACLRAEGFANPAAAIGAEAAAWRQR